MPAVDRSQAFAYRAAPSLRRRSASVALVVGLHALLLLLLLRLAPPPELPVAKTGPTLIDLAPGEEIEPAARRAPAKAQEAASGAPAPAPRPRPLPVPPRPVPKAESPLPPIRLWDGMEDFDLARQPRAAPGAGAEAGAAADAGAAAASAGPGDGPGGARLHAVQWYREPTDAELAAYLPAAMPATGWGMIACKTVADYRVEDCRELGQSPAGSGLSRALRQAAWQFRVRPPRLGGKPLLGVWVRIRIEWTQGARQ